MTISPIADPVARARAVAWHNGWRPWCFLAVALGLPGLVFGAAIVVIIIAGAGCATTSPTPARCNPVMEQCNPADHPPLAKLLPPWPFPSLLKPIDQEAADKGPEGAVRTTLIPNWPTMMDGTRALCRNKGMRCCELMVMGVAFQGGPALPNICLNHDDMSELFSPFAMVALWSVLPLHLSEGATR